MFLSRVELDQNNYETRRALLSPQMFHAAIERCFNNEGDKNRFELNKSKINKSEINKSEIINRKLWRLDSIGENLYLLVLSAEKPDFTKLIDQFCVLGIKGESKDYDVLLNKLQAGQRWGFRLKGNATHSVLPDDNSRGTGVRGKVIAYASLKYQLEWLHKKAQKCGFILENDKFTVVGDVNYRFRRKGQNDDVKLGVAIYEGELTVSDVELFKAALVQGIGRAKAYGCGLLTIADMRTASA